MKDRFDYYEDQARHNSYREGNVYPPTTRQRRFAEAISKELDVYPENETFDAYKDFISYYKDDYYDRKKGRRD